jgi:hypothetical protein
MNKSEHDNKGKEENKNLDALEQTLNLIKIGKGKGELRKLLNLSPTALSNRLKRLETLGCINLIGKYQIEITGSSLKHPEVTRALINKKLDKRGHGHNTTILFPKEENLWEKDRVKKEYSQKKIKRLGFGSYKLNYKGFTIWINKKSLTIYSNNSYFSEDALKSKFWALKDLDNLAKYLRGRFDLKGIYGLKIFREHYGIIFNKFAEWLLGQRRKMHVKDKGGDSILWIDDSMKDNIGAKVKLKEFEGKDPQKINTVGEWGKDMDDEGWPLISEMKGDLIDNKKELVNLRGVFPAMSEYNENLKLHTAVQKAQLEVAKETLKYLKSIDEKR